MLLLSAAIAVMMSLVMVHKYRVVRVVQQGQMVPVEVVKASSVGRKLSVHFRYQGQEGSVDITPQYWQQVKGQRAIMLFHSPAYPDVFVAPNPLYSEKYELMVGVLLVGFFVYSTVYFWKLVNDEI